MTRGRRPFLTGDGAPHTGDGAPFWPGTEPLQDRGRSPFLAVDGAVRCRSLRLAERKSRLDAEPQEAADIHMKRWSLTAKRAGAALALAATLALVGAGCGGGDGGPAKADLRTGDGGLESGDGGGWADLSEGAGADSLDGGPGGPDEFETSLPEQRFVVNVWEACSALGGCNAYAGAGRSMAWHEAESSLEVGPCAFIPAWLPVNCEPPCEPGTVCNWETGECAEPNPPVSAGHIEITGLKSGCTLVPATQYHYYAPRFSPDEEVEELFDEGDPITATAAGDDVPPFSLSVVGLAAMETPLACPPSLTDGEALVVTWTPASVPGKVSFSLQSANHATQFSRVVCETEDTGELIVDATLLSAFLADWHPVWSWNLARSDESWETVDDWGIGLSVHTSVGCSW